MTGNSNNQDHTKESNEKEALSEIEQYLIQVAGRLKRQKLIVFFCWHLTVTIAALLLVTIVAMVSVFDLNVLHYLILGLTINVILAFLLWSSQAFQAITIENLLEHFNRHLKEFEESAQLLILKQRSLTVLQRAQQKKIILVFQHLVKSRKIQSVLPRISRKHSAVQLFSVLILAGGYFAIPHVIELSKSTPLLSESMLYDNQNSQNDINGVGEKNNSELPPKIARIAIRITPPEYTMRETRELVFYSESEGLKQSELEALEGSVVTWEIEFKSESSAASNKVKLENSQGQIQERSVPQSLVWVDAKDNQFTFENTIENQFVVSIPLTQTTFYRLGYRLENSDSMMYLPEIYSVLITKDQPPKIDFIKPRQTLVELAKSDDARLDIEVAVSDDFGIGEVSLRASVAKGSGEAVKFRDEIFQFDSSESSDEDTRYYKQWSLKQLGMEPGDEVYFSVLADDNKVPEAQQTKSASVIVRWLDDAITEVAAEGMQIRFVPEYFRSQRQIIIETERLIADQKDLKPERFTEMSLDLGFSQQDLKQKYGQYLGDEAEEGSVVMHGLQDGYHGGEDIAQGEASAGLSDEGAHQHESEQDSDEHATHTHAGDNTVSDNPAGVNDGAADLISQFTHNHGTVEIGPLSGRDPKSWMKQAVSEMWQAELHLMMSEPAESLPFQYKAYQYLKLARQAERIYVKRLGFEPPPVKESNRLTGELSDIESYQKTLKVTENAKSTQRLLQQVMMIMHDADYQNQLSTASLETLKRFKDWLVQESGVRPVLIKYAATVERILVQKNLDLTSCSTCLDELRKKIWQMASLPRSLPKVSTGSEYSRLSGNIKYWQRQNKLIESISTPEDGSAKTTMKEPKQKLRGKTRVKSEALRYD